MQNAGSATCPGSTSGPGHCFQPPPCRRKVGSEGLHHIPCRWSLQELLQEPLPPQSVSPDRKKPREGRLRLHQQCGHASHSLKQPLTPSRRTETYQTVSSLFKQQKSELSKEIEQNQQQQKIKKPPKPTYLTPQSLGKRFKQTATVQMSSSRSTIVQSHAASTTRHVQKSLKRAKTIRLHSPPLPSIVSLRPATI